MKKIFGVIAWIGFLGLIGTAGGMEQNLIGLGQAILYIALFLILFIGGIYLAGGFETQRKG